MEGWGGRVSAARHNLWILRSCKHVHDNVLTGISIVCAFAMFHLNKIIFEKENEINYIHW